ncbi:unnamed protein product [Parajaminaea phylloscopi]
MSSSRRWNVARRLLERGLPLNGGGSHRFPGRTKSTWLRNETLRERQLPLIPGASTSNYRSLHTGTTRRNSKTPTSKSDASKSSSAAAAATDESNPKPSPVAPALRTSAATNKLSATSVAELSQSTAPKQTSAGDEETSLASEARVVKGAVRVTDKRSGLEARQAEIAARDKSRKEGSSSSSIGDAIKANTSSTPPPQQSTGGESSTPSASDRRESQQPSPGASSSSPTSSPAANISSSELLKQRLQQAQERLERPLPITGLGVTWSAAVSLDNEGTIIQQPSSVSGSTPGPTPSTHSNHQGKGGGDAPTHTDGERHTSSTAKDHGDAGIIPTATPDLNVGLPHGTKLFLEHLFDTRAFVQRLEQSGFLNNDRLAEESGHDKGDSRARVEEVQRWIAAAEEDALNSTASSTKSSGKGKKRQTSREDDEKVAQVDSPSLALSTQPLHRPHDPAQAIMELTSSLLKRSGSQAMATLLERTAVENQRYLFTAALSELRTELQVRARNDAAALRSITTLLQREVDGLSQKMKEDIEQMKHDIQVDMNNRKGEAKEEQNSLDQEIQDLNNRFTISLSDLKTEIEQSIKWDLTRRALALVFGIAAITVVSLFLADFLSKRKDRQLAEEAAAAANGGPAEGANPTSALGASASANPPNTGGGLFKKRGKGVAGSGTTPGTYQGGAAGSAGASTSSLRPEELGLIEQYDMDQEGRVV